MGIDIAEEAWVLKHNSVHFYVLKFRLHAIFLLVTAKVSQT